MLVRLRRAENGRSLKRTIVLFCVGFVARARGNKRVVWIFLGERL